MRWITRQVEVFGYSNLAQREPKRYSLKLTVYTTTRIRQPRTFCSAFLLFLSSHELVILLLRG